MIEHGTEPGERSTSEKDLIVEAVLARIGTREMVEDLEQEDISISVFYSSTFYENYDGELELLVRGRILRAPFREWRHDVANLWGYPEKYRRVVDLKLPLELAGYDANVVFLSRLARLVCELVAVYIESGGRQTVLTSGPVDGRLGLGEEPPPALYAPVLFGRRLANVYETGPASRLLPR